jgi:hypothetical protein
MPDYKTDGYLVGGDDHKSPPHGITAMDKVATTVPKPTREGNLHPELNKKLLKTLDQYNVHHLALDYKEDQRLITFFRNRPEWELDFEDASFVLFTRTNPILNHPNTEAAC